MPARHSLRWIAFAFLFVLASPLLRAQPIVDGVTVGAGLTSYHGDLDWNPTDGPAEFLAAGNLGVFVAADRSFGSIIAETALHYDRVAIDFPRAEMDLTMLSLDFNVGYGFDVIEPLFFRVFAGVSPMWVMTNYGDVALPDPYEFTEQESRFLLTFPVGVVIQDALRLGVRFTPTDNFDSVRGITDNLDLVSFVSVGYRFDLLRP